MRGLHKPGPGAPLELCARRPAISLAPPLEPPQIVWALANAPASDLRFGGFGLLGTEDTKEGVVQLACKCYHSTKNCSGIVFAGLLPSNHIKGKSASTSYGNNLARYRRWYTAFPGTVVWPYVLLLLAQTLLLFRQTCPRPIFRQTRRSRG